ncbi:MAG TPA: glycosyltransferase [Terriglobales bacterium]|jgi:glycosyltransferase involved in cell wall biosynthesis
MKILITNRVLASGSGTETVACDLATEFVRLGHDAAIYSPLLGPWAQQASSRGLTVFDDIRRVSPTPEIVHGQHHAQTLTALLRFPEARAVFVCHDATAWHDEALLFPRVRQYVAVDHRCLRRFEADRRVPQERVRVIFNAVDLRRFKPRPPLPAQPKRAAIFSNYASKFTHTGAVSKACLRLGLGLDVIGTSAGTATPVPEQALPKYDLVFAKARCALEAMAVGAAVVLCDFAGLGGMVTPENFSSMRKLNFGTGNLVQPLDPALIAAEIQKYDREQAASVAALARGEASLAVAAAEWLELYREILNEPRVAADCSQELAAVADYLLRWGYDARIAYEKEHIRRFQSWPLLGRCLHWLLESERARILRFRDAPPRR